MIIAFKIHIIPHPPRMLIFSFSNLYSLLTSMFWLCMILPLLLTVTLFLLTMQSGRHFGGISFCSHWFLIFIGIVVAGRVVSCCFFHDDFIQIQCLAKCSLASFSTFYRFHVCFLQDCEQRFFKLQQECLFSHWW